MNLPFAVFGNLFSGDGIIILMMLALLGSPFAIGIAIALIVIRKGRRTSLHPPPLPPNNDPPA